MVKTEAAADAAADRSMKPRRETEGGRDMASSTGGDDAAKLPHGRGEFNCYSAFHSEVATVRHFAGTLRAPSESRENSDGTRSVPATFWLHQPPSTRDAVSIIGSATSAIFAPAPT
jgi:hypothetical protein